MENEVTNYLAKGDPEWSDAQLISVRSYRDGLEPDMASYMKIMSPIDAPRASRMLTQWEMAYPAKSMGKAGFDQIDAARNHDNHVFYLCVLIAAAWVWIMHKVDQRHEISVSDGRELSGKPEPAQMIEGNSN